MQRNWIGRSEGADVDFEIADCHSAIPNGDRRIRVFTTRPDTLFGATYMVLAPEHRLVDLITTPEQRPAVQSYKAEVATKSDLERTESKEKTGVFTGAFAVNPVNARPIPIWIADYVLASYGTGAIMAVPGHDARDLEFAAKFNLPIVQVVQPLDGKDWRGFVEDGIAVHSANADLSLDGLPTPEAKRRITAWLETRRVGQKAINYKLRDWLFSRQRYWGEPFPIVWKTGPDGQPYHEALPESALPILPPPLEDYKPTPDGQPPLARAKDWVQLPDGSRRETNTMPQWAGSCWYYLRYLDTNNAKTFCGEEAERYWMSTSASCKSDKPHAEPSTFNLQPSTFSQTPGVDLYVGGTEHAVLHLLYARFWHKVLYDLGYVSTPEPFFRLVNQGLILGQMEFTKFVGNDGVNVSADEVEIVSDATPMIGRRKPTPANKPTSSTPTSEVFTGISVPETDLVKRGDSFYLKEAPDIRVDARSFKMSKSRGNVVNPDTILTDFGADALRLYEMFLGPLEMVKPWNTQGVEGVYRFLGRVWRLFLDEKSETQFEQNLAAEPARGPEFLERIQLDSAIKDIESTPAQLRTLHACIKKVTEDLDGLRFNTAISALMVFVNEAMTWENKPRAVLRDFLILLQPFAPHLAEELWSKLSAGDMTTQNSSSSERDKTQNLSYQAWPRFDPALLVEDTLQIPVQVNGKLRDVISVPAAASQAELEAAAKASDKAKQFIEGKTVRKIIVVPKKLVNIVVG
jgi:leucyl-tRNA synthetase